ncbi:hypothetical protein D3C85_1716340 [compost metagenome]
MFACCPSPNPVLVYNTNSKSPAALDFATAFAAVEASIAPPAKAEDPTIATPSCNTLFQDAPAV